jgi:hypothetical protein
MSLQREDCEQLSRRKMDGNDDEPPTPASPHPAALTCDKDCPGDAHEELDEIEA